MAGAAAAVTTGGGPRPVVQPAGESPTKRRKKLGKQAQIETNTNKRRVGIANFLGTFAVVAGCTFLPTAMDFREALDKAKTWSVTTTSTLFDLYMHLDVPVLYPALPVAIMTACRSLYPHHVTRPLIEHVFAVGGMVGGNAISLWIVFQACRAFTIDVENFATAAFIREANLHLRTAGVLRAETEEIQAEQDRDDVAAGLAEYKEGGAAAAAVAGGVAAAAAAAGAPAAAAAAAGNAAAAAAGGG